MKAKLYTIKGEMKQEVTLPAELDVKNSVSILDQAVRVYEDRTHFGLRKVKTRSEINATKKKLYKQKGTGGARHGAKSAHIFVGGGVVHGPTGEKRALSLPLKMKKVAKNLALSRMFKNGKAVLVEGLEKLTKTNDAAKAVESIKKTLNINTKITIVLSNNNLSSKRFLRNIENVKIANYASLNAFDILRSNTLVLDSSIFDVKKGEVKKTVKTVKKVTKKK